MARQATRRKTTKRAGRKKRELVPCPLPQCNTKTKQHEPGSRALKIHTRAAKGEIDLDTALEATTFVPKDKTEYIDTTNHEGPLLGIQREDGTMSFREYASKDRVDAMSNELESARKRLVSENAEALSSFFATVMAARRYSEANTMLISLQEPNGRIFRSATDWRKDGYALKPGARGCWIFAPIMGSRTVTDEDGNPKLDEDGKEVKETFRKRGYRSVLTYSENQLDPLVKEPPKDPLVEYINHQTERTDVEDSIPMRQDLTRVAEALGVNVKFVRDPNKDLRGYTMLSDSEDHEFDIVINDHPDISDASKTNTLAHEMGHVLCGHLDGENSTAYHSGDYDKDRGDFETEAEMFAFGMSSTYGIDMGDKSAAYIGNWSMLGGEGRIERATQGVHAGMQNAFVTLDNLNSGMDMSEVREKSQAMREKIVHAKRKDR